MSASLLSGTDAYEELVLVAERAREICGAATAGVPLADGGELVIEATDGLHADVVRGMRSPSTRCSRGRSTGAADPSYG